MANVARNGRPRGTVLIEAALIIPLLLLLTLALIEYGWFFIKSEQTANAARQGVRTAVLPDADTEEARAEVIALMDTAGLGESGYTIEFVPTDVTTVPVGETVTVVVTIPYENISLTGGPLVPLPSTLRAAVSMAKEGP
ncbi:MAG: TadE/TadG family type IV pilus assembly protein [Planctomycetota bacterium]|jgi:Flp pilus assembly protein TadG